MALRKVWKILLYACAGILGSMLLLMLGVKLALDRAPRYQAEIKEWVHGRIGYHIAFAHVSPAFRWYGPELYFERLELRSKDDQRVLARAAGGRDRAWMCGIWCIAASCWPGASRSTQPTWCPSHASRPDKFRAWPPRSNWAARTMTAPTCPTIRLNDLPAGTLAIRGGIVILVDNWNARTLPHLELRDVELEDSPRHVGGDIRGLVLKSAGGTLGGDVTLNGAVQGPGPLEHAELDRAGPHAAICPWPGWRLLPTATTCRDWMAAPAVSRWLRAGAGAALARADLDFDAANVTTQVGRRTQREIRSDCRFVHH